MMNVYDRLYRESLLILFSFNFLFLTFSTCCEIRGVSTGMCVDGIDLVVSVMLCLYTCEVVELLHCISKVRITNGQVHTNFLQDLLFPCEKSLGTFSSLM